MPYRKTVFVNEGVYHIVNRGVNHAPIYIDQRDYNRFINIADFLRFRPATKFSYFNSLPSEQQKEILNDLKMRNNPIVEILAFCLIPNHFHLLLRQLRDQGIQLFMRDLQNSYTKYFNTRHKRVGPLYQSVFRSIEVESTEQLSHLSRYIHLNPSSSSLVKINDLKSYQFSSFNSYLGDETFEFVNSDVVLGNFESCSEYKQFVLSHAEEQKQMDIIKHLTLES